MSSHTNPRVAWTAAVLLLLFAAQAISSMRVKSTTVDEITYITAGYYHWVTGDFEYNMTNPPVMKLVAAAPLLALDLELPTPEGDPSSWNAVEEWQYARRFLYENTVDADTILFVARLPIVGIGVLLGVLVFVWARRLYGPTGGLVSLFMYSFSPNLLAHTRLATQDLGLAATCLFVSYLLWDYLERPRWPRLLAIGAALGLAAGVKTPFILLFPAFAVYIVVGAVRDRGFGVDKTLPLVGRVAESKPRSAQVLSLSIAICVVVAVALFCLNAVYGFHGSLSPLADLSRASALAERLPGGPTGSLAHAVLSTPSPVPLPYISGLLFQMTLTASSGVYFFGEVHHEDLWYLMSTALLLKTPIPTIIAASVAVGTVLLGRGRRRGELLLLLVAASFMGLFTLKSNVAGGVRYVLLVLPCLFVVAGRLARTEVSWTGVKQVSAAVLGLWYVGSAIWIHPHYLAYFNESIGGPKNGYKYLDGPNLDWGQDLKLLARYLEEHGIERPKLAYFGSGDARYYGIEYDYLPSVGLSPNNPGEYWWYELDNDEKRMLNPQKGLIAVSVNLLTRSQWLSQMFKGTYDWLEDEVPVDQVGYSILIYDMGESP